MTEVGKVLTQANRAALVLRQQNPLHIGMFWSFAVDRTVLGQGVFR